MACVSISFTPIQFANRRVTFLTHFSFFKSANLSMDSRPIASSYVPPHLRGKVGAPSASVSIFSIFFDAVIIGGLASKEWY